MSLFEERLIEMGCEVNNENHIAEKLVSGEYNARLCVCVCVSVRGRSDGRNMGKSTLFNLCLWIYYGMCVQITVL